MLWNGALHTIINKFYGSLWGKEDELKHILDTHVTLQVEESGEFAKRYMDRDIVISYLTEAMKQPTNLKHFSITYDYKEITVEYKHFDSPKNYINIFTVEKDKLVHIKIIIWLPVNTGSK